MSDDRDKERARKLSHLAGYSRSEEADIIYREIRTVRAEAILAEREAWSKLTHDRQWLVDQLFVVDSARTATQAEGMMIDGVWVNKGKVIGVMPLPDSPQSPASPSQEGGMREALEEQARLIDRLASVVESISVGTNYVAFARKIAIDAAAALAHDGGKGS